MWLRFDDPARLHNSVLSYYQQCYARPLPAIVVTVTIKLSNQYYC